MFPKKSLKLQALRKTRNKKVLYQPTNQPNQTKLNQILLYIINISTQQTHLTNANNNRQKQQQQQLTTHQQQCIIVVLNIGKGKFTDKAKCNGYEETIKTTVSLAIWFYFE